MRCLLGNPMMQPKPERPVIIVKTFLSRAHSSMSFSILVSVFQGSTWCRRTGRTWSASINRERTASSIPRRAGNRGYVRARSAPTTWSRSSAKNAVVASPWRGTRTATWITNADTSRGFSVPTADSAASKRHRFTPTSGRNIRKRRSLSSIWSSEHDRKIASLIPYPISSNSSEFRLSTGLAFYRDLRTSLKTNVSQSHLLLPYFPFS